MTSAASNSRPTGPAMTRRRLTRSSMPPASGWPRWSQLTDGRTTASDAIFADWVEWADSTRFSTAPRLWEGYATAEVDAFRKEQPVTETPEPTDEQRITVLAEFIDRALIAGDGRTSRCENQAGLVDRLVQDSVHFALEECPQRWHTWEQRPYQVPEDATAIQVRSAPRTPICSTGTALVGLTKTPRPESCTGRVGSAIERGRGASGSGPASGRRGQSSRVLDKLHSPRTHGLYRT